MMYSRRLRKREATAYHLQLCVSMLCMMLVFVAGIDQTAQYGSCVAVSVLLHYFTLVAVAWMTAEAVLMFKKLVFVFEKTSRNFVILISVICWGKLTAESLWVAAHLPTRLPLPPSPLVVSPVRSMWAACQPIICQQATLPSSISLVHISCSEAISAVGKFMITVLAMSHDFAV